MIALLLLAAAGQWTPPLEVRHEETLCLTYQARVDAGLLVVRAAIQPGWHTFSMDNKRRAEEKLAGKKSLGIDHPTEITLSGGLASVGPWFQTPPKDFSHPELRWFSWGFEKDAVFAAKVKRTGTAPVKINIRGQACTDAICKNIDVEIRLPAVDIGSPAEAGLQGLIQVSQ